MVMTRVMNELRMLLFVLRMHSLIKLVRIAYGYSYSSNVKEYGYEKLMIEADKLMYENKEMIKNKEKSLNRDTIIYS